MAKYLSESLLRSIIQEEIYRIFEEEAKINSSDVEKLFSELDKIAQNIAKKNFNKVKQEVEKVQREKKAEIAERRLKKKLEGVKNIEEHLDKIDLYFRKEVDKIEEEEKEGEITPKEEKLIDDFFSELVDIDDSITEEAEPKTAVSFSKLPPKIRNFVFDKLDSMRNRYEKMRFFGIAPAIIINSVLAFLYGAANQDREIANQIREVVLDILGTDFDSMGATIPVKLAAYVIALAAMYLVGTVAAEKIEKSLFLNKIKPRLRKYLDQLKGDIKDDLQ